jgi:hypothetical protein
LAGFQILMNTEQLESFIFRKKLATHTHIIIFYCCCISFQILSDIELLESFTHTHTHIIIFYCCCISFQILSDIELLESFTHTHTHTHTHCTTICNHLLLLYFAILIKCMRYFILYSSNSYWLVFFHEMTPTNALETFSRILTPRSAKLTGICSSKF